MPCSSLVILVKGTPKYYPLETDIGRFTETGTATNLQKSAVVVAESIDFDLTGKVADLIYTPFVGGVNVGHFELGSPAILGG